MTIHEWLRERFDADDTDDCITVPGWKPGYVRYKAHGQKVHAHVVVCEWTHGPRPDGMDAAHSCGNKSCVNRRHVRWLTRRENILEKIEHRTMARGERHGKAKLTEHDVRAIRRMSGEGSSLSELARRFGVSEPTIGDIRAGRTWAWLN